MSMSNRAVRYFTTGLGWGFKALEPTANLIEKLDGDVRRRGGQLIEVDYVEFVNQFGDPDCKISNLSIYKELDSQNNGGQIDDSESDHG